MAGLIAWRALVTRGRLVGKVQTTLDYIPPGGIVEP